MQTQPEQFVVGREASEEFLVDPSKHDQYGTVVDGLLEFMVGKHTSCR